MRKKTYQERVDDYLKAEYGRTFSVSETNSTCEDFAKLPLLDQCNIIRQVWNIDFDDEIERNATTFKKKIILFLWKLNGKTDYCGVEGFVETVFLFFEMFIMGMILCLIATGIMYIIANVCHVLHMILFSM